MTSTPSTSGRLSLIMRTSGRIRAASLTTSFPRPPRRRPRSGLDVEHAAQLGERQPVPWATTMRIRARGRRPDGPDRRVARHRRTGRTWAEEQRRAPPASTRRRLVVAAYAAACAIGPRREASSGRPGLQRVRGRPRLAVGDRRRRYAGRRERWSSCSASLDERPQARLRRHPLLAPEVDLGARGVAGCARTRARSSMPRDEVVNRKIGRTAPIRSFIGNAGRHRPATAPHPSTSTSSDMCAATAGFDRRKLLSRRDRRRESDEEAPRAMGHEDRRTHCRAPCGADQVVLAVEGQRAHRRRRRSPRRCLRTSDSLAVLSLAVSTCHWRD